MKIKWVAGTKTHYTLAILWTILAAVSFAKGNYFIGMLELIIAVRDLRDAKAGIEVTMLELSMERGAK